jgi:hypothetical protein
MTEQPEPPRDLTLPVVVWRNLAEDLHAIADAIEAQLETFEPALKDEAYLTLRFDLAAIPDALERLARAQIGDEAFEALVAEAAQAEAEAEEQE